MHSTASWPRALTYSGPCHRDDTLMSTSSLSVVSSGGWGDLVADGLGRGP